MIRYEFLRFPEGKFKALTCSYDDGCKQDLQLVELFNRYGIKATFNLNSMEMKKGKGLSKEQVEELLLGAGHEVAVHGYNHRALGLQRPIDGIRDVLDSRMELEQLYGRIIRGMAYPDSGITKFTLGTDYPMIKQYLTDLDIVYARTLGGDNKNFLLPTDWHSWMPSVHHSNPEIMDYVNSFNALELSGYHASRLPRLMYVWGHAFEFDNKWEQAEQIFSALSGKEDVWYATNMEIYEYCRAYEALIHSADGKRIYNPTLFTLWLEVNGKPYTVKSGETLDLHGEV